MISHKHKCIFIHITKCAGSSVEHAFGIDVNMHDADYESLFGWSEELCIHLQHATPQQLLDHKLLDRRTWDSYYKFIVVRNPWDRANSDYKWIVKGRTIIDSFENYLLKKGDFKDILTDNKKRSYRGDHLNSQKDYFFLDGKYIDYNTIIRFENINEGFDKVVRDLQLKSDFFEKKINNTKNNNHYSFFYNTRRKRLVANFYAEDINFFQYTFEEKKGIIEFIKSFFPSIFFLPKEHWIKKLKKVLNSKIKLIVIVKCWFII